MDSISEKTSITATAVGAATISSVLHTPKTMFLAGNQITWEGVKHWKKKALARENG